MTEYPQYPQYRHLSVIWEWESAATSQRGKNSAMPLAEITNMSVNPNI